MTRNPLWYKDAVIYELHVRAFGDANADGIGDFVGLTEKLDYLQDLGVTAVWLLPFYPSPLRDDGYDIGEYTAVNPSYGHLRDFKRFLRAAHERGLRVITELVINHTSIEHPWFQRARRAPKGSKWRDFYVWGDSPDRYQDARIIFQDFETSNWTWDPVAQQYYWHRFYSHQPDLNFDNLAVHEAVFRVLDFWMSMGVDGMRLDAVPYLYERQGTNCENLPETHGFLKKLRAYVDSKYEGRMLLAEANQWPEDAAAYFGDGDECHMNFHFPLMPRMFMALQLEDSYPIVDILEQTPAIDDSCQWAMFLRNHDELTLEMVTDEDRDYMYRMYARDPRARINLGIRRRLAPLLESRSKVELMNGLLMSMPGTPVIYYGDEIGMGDNVYLGDRNGVRTPMQWSSDRNAGFSRANPQKLYFPVIIDPEYHYESINVEAQQNNSSSLLWWMKRIIALRKKHLVFGRGGISFPHHDNHRILAFIRSYQEEHVLVVANLSRRTQCVSIDLSRFVGARLVEMFGHTDFPVIGDRPYFLSLAPHVFHWFSVEAERAAADRGPSRGELDAPQGFRRLFAKGTGLSALERTLAEYLPGCRWFRAKTQTISKLSVERVVRLAPQEDAPVIAVLSVEYGDASPEIYALPLAWASGAEAQRVIESYPKLAVATLHVGGAAPQEGILYDAAASERFSQLMLELAFGRGAKAGPVSEIRVQRGKAQRALRGGGPLAARVLSAEQTNTSIAFGDRLVMKLVRKLEPGKNPEVELVRALTETAEFPNIPAFAGAMDLRMADGDHALLATIQAFVPNQGDAWQATLHSLDQFMERALATSALPPVPEESSLVLSEQALPEWVVAHAGPYVELVRLLGRRVAELHLALLNLGEGPDLGSEPFSTLYQRSLYEAARKNAAQAFRALRASLTKLPEDTRELARTLLELRAGLNVALGSILQEDIRAVRTRVHGDLHLGQVLFTGKDFFLIDFEGEPARSLGERRFKRSPLRDVTSMMRSFRYASEAALRTQDRPEDLVHLRPFGDAWVRWVSASFLGAYLGACGDAPFIPRERSQLHNMILFYELDKCVYELGYELNNRPDWVAIPIRSLVSILERMV